MKKYRGIEIHPSFEKTIQGRFLKENNLKGVLLKVPFYNCNITRMVKKKLVVVEKQNIEKFIDDFFLEAKKTLKIDTKNDDDDGSIFYLDKEALKKDMIVCTNIKNW